MQGRIYQINISRGGVPKREIPEAVITIQGIRGDGWAHPRIHGGPNQALLLVSIEDIECLQRCGYRVYAGALGENLTTVGIDFRKIRVGDQFRAGEVELAITKLRKPCQTLDGIKRGIQKELYHATPGAANWGRGGFYAKIVTPGTIVKNDIIAKAGP